MPVAKRKKNEIGLGASAEASRMMLASLDPGCEQMSSAFRIPASTMFTEGPSTVMPLGLSSVMGSSAGDAPVTYAGADVGRYQSKLERAVIPGKPDTRFSRYFKIMLLLQVAFDALKPGRSMPGAKSDVGNTFSEPELSLFQRHHSGHGIGLGGHEWPFIDKGSDEVTIEEGIVLSFEPGIYVPGMAGYPQSDTVVTRGDGAERLTYYPRDLESLTIPA
jgi:Xaa-Pro aminopeptidase